MGHPLKAVTLHRWLPCELGGTRPSPSFLDGFCGGDWLGAPLMNGYSGSCLLGPQLDTLEEALESQSAAGVKVAGSRIVL